MKLSPRTELYIIVPFIGLVTATLIIARIESVQFGGLILNKWTVLLFYALAVADLIHIKLKGSKCKSSCTSKEPPGPSCSAS